MVWDPNGSSGKRPDMNAFRQNKAQSEGKIEKEKRDIAEEISSDHRL